MNEHGLQVLICIPTCHKFDYSGQDDGNHRSGPNHRVEAVRSTWFKDVADYYTVDAKFFYGRGATREPLADEVFLDVPDDYEHLPDKVIAMVQYGLKNNYDYLLKVDDDTAVYVHRAIKELIAGEFDYAGRVHGDMLFGGAGYWLSRRAMWKVETRPDTTFEDRWVGQCMVRGKIEAVILPGHLQFTSPIPPNAVTVHGFSPEEMIKWYSTVEPE